MHPFSPISGFDKLLSIRWQVKGLFSSLGATSVQRFPVLLENASPVLKAASFFYSQPGANLVWWNGVIHRGEPVKIDRMESRRLKVLKDRSHE